MATLILGSATLAMATTVQVGDLRVTVLAQLKPYKLPRAEPAPIAVFIAGALQSASGKRPPQLQAMRVLVNRHGLLQSKGLARCSLGQLRGSSSERALVECGDALVGSGQFWAHIVLPDQGAYPTRGRLLVFNARYRGRPALYTHIFTSNPFNSAFTIPFAIKRVSQGRYGTELSASFPEALGSWGYVDRIKLTLRKEYRHRSRTLSYFNAACPAPKGTKRAAFSLARATLSFDTTRLSADVVKTCGVEE
ncbi:MAG TPA: hypothetical protein VFX85_11110 [Solirubrobacterales bacterium]|nr:hypothetical protein [Solirubrobacterales bacterium]